MCREVECVLLPPWRSYLRTALTLPARLPMAIQYYASARMHEAVARHGVGADLVYAHSIRMAEFARRLSEPTVLGMQISQALNYGRMLAHVKDPLRQVFYRIEASKVRPTKRTCAPTSIASSCADPPTSRSSRDHAGAQHGHLPPRPGPARRRPRARGLSESREPSPSPG